MRADLADVDAEPRRRLERPRRRHRLGLALRVDRLALAVLDRRSRRAVGRLADEDAVAGAAAWSRAAVLTTSPGGHALAASGRASSATSASPVVIPIRTWSSRPSASLAAIASRIGERGANGALGVVLVRDGAPKSAMTASPMNFSTVPP